MINQEFMGVSDVNFFYFRFLLAVNKNLKKK